MIRNSLLVFLMCSELLAYCPAAFSADGSQALMLFQQGKFKEALPLFEKIARDKPNDANALYYYALTLHRSGRVNEAKLKYSELVSRFPNSPAAQQAVKILIPPRVSTLVPPKSQVRSFSGSQRFDTSTQNSENGSTDYSQLPQEARIYFRREGNSLHVDAQLNNRPITMVFDTGAEACIFGKNHLKELGIAPPQGAPIGMASGVGDGGNVPIWTTTVDMKVGPIVRKNMTILVQENLPSEPLLGQTFFKDFRYTIDNGANSIHFAIKQRSPSVYASRSHSPSTTTADAYAVPFTLEGNEMIVNAQVNGKTIPMIFDTGASTTVFTMSHIRQLGISIPEDEVEQERHRGIAGETSGIGFPVSRLRLGPIEKSNFRISVTEGMSGHPLLGQTFYGDWQYSIDNANKLIHFLRR